MYICKNTYLIVLMNKNIFLLLTCFLLFATSCKTKEKASTLNYMQNAEQIATEDALKNSNSTIQVGDQLVIIITAKDMQVVKPFNQNYSSGEIAQSSIPGGNVPTRGQENVSGPTYIVDFDGNIDFPILGKIKTSDKTLIEFKDEMRDLLRKYIINPSVNVRVANYKVTVLGEVNKPGQYTIPDGQATLLNALGLAGDLTMYGRRNDVLLIRTENGIVTKERINLLDVNFVNSPYYQLKQGDVVYVSANQTKDKTSKLDPNTPIYISAAGIIVTILALVFKK